MKLKSLLKKVIALNCLAVLPTFSGCTQQKEVKVNFPEEQYGVVETAIDNKPAVIVVNTSLKDFEAKDIFGWSCSLIIPFKETAENGMPTQDESDFIYKYFQTLDTAIKGDPVHPNALFLARITFDGKMEIIWQIYDPKPVHQFLQEIIENKKYPRELDYQIEYDKEWKNVEWYLQDFESSKS